MWTEMQLDSLHWFSQRHSPTPHFWGAHPGGYDPQMRTRPRFLYYAPTPKFHHAMFISSLFGSYRVDKQTDAAENVQHSSLHYDVG